MRNNQLNIVHVVSYYPPHLGGMENCAAEIAEQLYKKGCNVSVLTSNIGFKDEYLTSNLVKAKYLKSLELAHTPIIFSLFFNLLKLARNTIVHIHISQALTPEIVYLVSKIKKFPYVAHIHLDVDPSGFFGFILEPYKKIFLKRVLQNASKIICLSDAMKNEIATKYNLNLQKMVVIPNGVGDKYFFDRKIFPKKQYRILNVGRLAKQKNLHLLLESVALVKNNITVDLVGDGEEMQYLKTIVKKLGLRSVIFHGKKTGEDLLNLYSNADIFLLTSEREGMSLSMLEAMASGLPIVAVENPGIDNLLSGIGLITKANPKDISRTIDKLLSDTKLQKEIVFKEKNLAKKYTWSNTADLLIDLYNKIL